MSTLRTYSRRRCALVAAITALGAIFTACPSDAADPPASPPLADQPGVEEITSSAAAGGAYDHCNQILQGDLFNKITSNNQARAAASNVLALSHLSLSDDAAYEQYSKDYDQYSMSAEHGGGGVNIMWGLVGADGDGSTTHTNKLTTSEFTERWHRFKSLNQSSVFASSASDSFTSSAYASYIRDPNTIQAWAKCVTQDPKPGLYAFGSRDDAGNGYVNVIWAPGDFAGIAPSIRVDFVDENGLHVLATPGVMVAVGTGRAFGLRAPDARATLDVKVNGTLTDAAGHTLGSFTATARVPPVVLTPAKFPPPEPARNPGTCTVPSGASPTGRSWGRVIRFGPICRQIDLRVPAPSSAPSAPSCPELARRMHCNRLE